MFVGVKIVEPSSEGFLIEVRDHIDFVEVMAVVGNDYGFIKDVGLPVVIHNMHFSWGVNFVNPVKAELNRRSLEYSLKLADLFDARRVIVHPERHEDDSCSEDSFVRFMGGFPDGRIVIESMPYVFEGHRFYGYDFETMGRLLHRTGLGMCLDFAHSSLAARALGKDPVGHVRELMGLNPVHFHLSDTRLLSGKDMHTHLGLGDLPLGEYAKMLPPDAWVTLETPHEVEKILEDVRSLKG